MLEYIPDGAPLSSCLCTRLCSVCKKVSTLSIIIILSASPRHKAAPHHSTTNTYISQGVSYNITLAHCTAQPILYSARHALRQNGPYCRLHGNPRLTCHGKVGWAISCKHRVMRHHLWLQVTNTGSQNTPTSQASFKAFSWRMASEQSPHKAPTYAKDKPLPPINDGRKFEPAPLPNQIFELPEQPERPSTAASTTRPRNNQPQQQNLTRRRKISVPELGPMTTVQESAMDSRKPRTGTKALLVLRRCLY